jgi:hypothetical protein
MCQTLVLRCIHTTYQTGDKMPQYEINFTAYVSDSIVIDFDGDVDEIDESHIRNEWDGLPLINGATYDWNGLDFEVVELESE